MCTAAGPSDTPFEGGVFELSLTLPSTPPTFSPHSNSELLLTLTSRRLSLSCAAREIQDQSIPLRETSSLPHFAGPSLTLAYRTSCGPSCCSLRSFGLTYYSDRMHKAGSASTS